MYPKHMQHLFNASLSPSNVTKLLLRKQDFPKWWWKVTLKHKDWRAPCCWVIGHETEGTSVRKTARTSCGGQSSNGCYIDVWHTVVSFCLIKYIWTIDAHSICIHCQFIINLCPVAVNILHLIAVFYVFFLRGVVICHWI